MNQLPIEETTKVAALLDAYPELEEVLIGIAPPFKKLRNPVLRRSVAKVASLRQAAAVAGIPASELVNRLRKAVGQEQIAGSGDDAAAAYLGERPEWYSPNRIVGVVDEGELPADGPMPLVVIVKHAVQLNEGEILELRTSFLPAPGIDAMSRKGFVAWTTRSQAGEYHTYFTPESKGGDHSRGGGSS